MNGLAKQEQFKRLEIGGLNILEKVNLKKKLNLEKLIPKLQLILILREVNVRVRINMASTGRKTGKLIKLQGTQDGTSLQLSIQMKRITVLNSNGVSGVKSKEICQSREKDGWKC